MKILKSAIFCLLGAVMFACETKPQSETPGNVFAFDNILAIEGKVLLAADRAGSRVVKIDFSKEEILSSVGFDQPVNRMALIDGKLWVVTDGPKGELYNLDTAGLEINSRIEMGYSPASITRSANGKLWVAQRYLNQIWEVDTAEGTVLTRLDVGREPIDAAAFSGGKYILVANNLPEGAATDFPLGAKMDVVDTETKSVVKRIALPNGTTDVRGIAVDSEERFAYVTHLLGRYQIPTNQVDRGWMMTNAMSIIDLGDMSLLTTVLLDTPQKGAANPCGITLTGDGKFIVVALAGTHEIASIDRFRLHERIEKAQAGEKVVPSFAGFDNIPNDAGFLHDLRSFIPTGGNGPRAVAVLGDKIYTANYFTGELVEIDLQADTRAISFGGSLGSTMLGEGEMYFHDAKYCFQQWQSCASCHPNQGRVDGLNWDLLNDGPGNLKSTKSLLYSHKTPPAMITGIRKDAYTAVKSGIKHIFFGNTPDSVPEAMDRWLISLEALPSPLLADGGLSEAAGRGKVHYDKYCLSCHGGEYYTDLKQYRVSWTMGRDKDVPMDVPTLREIWRTAPYLYDGRSYTMRQMLEVHGPHDPMAPRDLDDLAEYALSL